MQLSDFKKNFYREASSISSMKEEDVTAWRKKRDIVVFGNNIPRPIRTFEEAGFPSYIMAEIERAGFEKPTGIQAQGWPMAMSGRDVIGIAETGSGMRLCVFLVCFCHNLCRMYIQAKHWRFCFHALCILMLSHCCEVVMDQLFW